MAKTLILTPNRTEQCGMYQLAKDLARELDGIVLTRKEKEAIRVQIKYSADTVITLFYPMHEYGLLAKKFGKRWICYDQGIPPTTKEYFPNFWRRLYMKLFAQVNETSMQGADKYWDVTKRPQKPRWTEKAEGGVLIYPPGVYNTQFREMLSAHNQHPDKKLQYALYVGRKTDYKNFDYLWRLMDRLEIPFITPPENCSDEDLHKYYSYATLYVTASTWEGYGRTVMEAAALGVPFVCFDTGAHKRQLLKSGGNGLVVPNHDFKMFEEKVEESWKFFSD